MTKLKRRDVDFAKVDLGAAHNGRVAYRNVFTRADGSRYIVDKSRHITVVRFDRSRALTAIKYVTWPESLR